MNMSKVYRILAIGLGILLGYGGVVIYQNNPNNPQVLVLILLCISFIFYGASGNTIVGFIRKKKKIDSN